MPPGHVVDLRIHTNGVLLNQRHLDVFDEHDIKVGISLDGDREANDRHRRYRDGRSSYDQVVRAVSLLREQPTSTPACCAPSMCATTRSPSTRPCGNSNPPRRLPAPPRHLGRTSRPAHADGLRRLADRHLRTLGEPAASDGDPPLRLRHPDSQGEPSLTGAIGLDPSGLLVVETERFLRTGRLAQGHLRRGDPRPGTTCSATRSARPPPIRAFSPGRAEPPSFPPNAGSARSVTSLRRAAVSPSVQGRIVRQPQRLLPGPLQTDLHQGRGFNEEPQT